MSPNAEPSWLGSPTREGGVAWDSVLLSGTLILPPEGSFLYQSLYQRSDPEAPSAHRARAPPQLGRAVLSEGSGEPISTRHRCGRAWRPWSLGAALVPVSNHSMGFLSDSVSLTGFRGSLSQLCPHLELIAAAKTLSPNKVSFMALQVGTSNDL